MQKSRKNHLPLNALRAFEASARHLSFTKAGLELRVTQAAVSQMVRALEASLRVRLFRRIPRGLLLTDEGQALLPIVSTGLGQLRIAMNAFERGHVREVVTVGLVSTFGNRLMLPRLDSFAKSQPMIDLRCHMNNNSVDIAGEGLDYAIRFGDGAWQGTDATFLFDAPLSVVCSAAIAKRMKGPESASRETLLRSYRENEWPQWFAATGHACPPLVGTMMFDSSIALADAAINGFGLALLPWVFFEPDIKQERLIKPFSVEVNAGAYWLVKLKSKAETRGMTAFKSWLLEETADLRKSRVVPPRRRRFPSSRSISAPTNWCGKT